MPIPLHAIPCRPQNRCGGGCAGVMGPRCESRYPAETPRPVGAAYGPRNPEGRTSPVTPTTRQLPGLRAPVDLWRDAWGIAHLRARGADDAFFALGHVHASDRLWQMDALRRRTLGRYAEWLGPSALPMDMLARRLGLTECCRRDLLAINDDTRAMLAAYTAGVNAFIATGPLPPEDAVLGATPEPWQVWHCIAVLRQTSLLLNSVYPKLWRAIALPIVGAAALDRLRMNDGSDDLACMPPGASADRIAPDMAALADAMAAFIGHSDTEAGAGGSNNWALHGSRTRSGRPLLAGDPHRVLDMPNLYLQCHVACDEFDVIGLTSPGVPGFPHFAHNRDVAWCVTVAFVDTADLYLERFEDQGRRYLLRTDADGGNAQWAEVARRVERIRVRGQADVDCEVLVTARGPVVAGAATSGSALVLRHSSDAEAGRSGDRPRPPRPAAGRPGRPRSSQRRPRAGAPAFARRGGRPLLRLPAADDGGAQRRGTVRGQPRLGPGRPQPGGRRHAGPHRTPCARQDTAPPGRQRLAARAGLARPPCLARLACLGAIATADRPRCRPDRHGQQPHRRAA